MWSIDCSATERYVISTSSMSSWIASRNTGLSAPLRRENSSASIDRTAGWTTELVRSGEPGLGLGLAGDRGVVNPELEGTPSGPRWGASDDL